MRCSRSGFCLVCVAAWGWAGLLNLPGDIATSVKQFGAYGDGVHDDSRAIQRALDTNRTEDIDYNGRPKTLFFPAGTYLVSDTLHWRGCALTIQGQGTGATVIKLKDTCALFGSPARPAAVFRTPDGNMSFRQNFHDLTIHTGRGNRGAIGLDYISSNSGTVRDVEIVSGDSAGVCGLDMTRAWPGPLLVKNLRVAGFDYGIRVAHSEYGPTFEDITLEGQRVAGLANNGNVCAIRGLHSVNAVPAVTNTPGYGYVILLDALLAGGAAGTSAIASDGFVYLRNVSSQGSAYASALRQGGATVSGAYHREYISGTVQKLWATSPDHSLNLPVADAPVYHDDDTAKWGRFVPRWYGDTGPLQALLNSGKSTIYFAAGVNFCYEMTEFTVPPSVRRIIGFHGVVNHEVGPAGIVFRVTAPGAEPLIVEQFGYGVGVRQSCARPVALKHGCYYYVADSGAGDAYFEDVQADSLVFRSGQRVWMRQLNTEGSRLHVVNNGADLWILGVKTEGKGTVVRTADGGRTEVLGTLLYPCQTFAAADTQPAFEIDRAAGSFIYRVSSYVTNGNYWVQVRERRGSETRRWRPASNTAMICPLFSGFDSTQMAGVQETAPAARSGYRSARWTVVVQGQARVRCSTKAEVFDLRGRRVLPAGALAGRLPAGGQVLRATHGGAAERSTQ